MQSKNIFWVIRIENYNMALNRGAFCNFESGTQVQNPVADKTKEIEVWDLKYTETYTPSIVSQIFIYIAKIYFELLALKITVYL